MNLHIIQMHFFAALAFPSGKAKGKPPNEADAKLN